MNLPDIEIVANLVHEAWVKSKLTQGFTSRKSETGEELMVPYNQLTEASKELDRAMVRAVYVAVQTAQKDE
ncbi:MAG TPA: RyR domain-containing protein [Pyrinomonadaceae bacterium]|nr:RyR domain-containing protein [Pyrinomonadaceae bacterium]